MSVRQEAQRHAVWLHDSMNAWCVLKQSTVRLGGVLRAAPIQRVEVPPR